MELEEGLERLREEWRWYRRRPDEYGERLSRMFRRHVSDPDAVEALTRNPGLAPFVCPVPCVAVISVEVDRWNRTLLPRDVDVIFGIRLAQDQPETPFELICGGRSEGHGVAVPGRVTPLTHDERALLTVPLHFSDAFLRFATPPRSFVCVSGCLPPLARRQTSDLPAGATFVSGIAPLDPPGSEYL